MRLDGNNAIMNLAVKEGAMAFSGIILKKEDHIATITLNRPEKLNAISRQMEEELIEALADVAGDSDVRAMVLTGAGNAFCSGADISQPICEV